MCATRVHVGVRDASTRWCARREYTLVCAARVNRSRCSGSHSLSLRFQGVARRSESSVTELDVGSCTNPRRHRSQSGSGGGLARLSRQRTDSGGAANLVGGSAACPRSPRSPGPTIVVSGGGGRRPRTPSSDSAPGGSGASRARANSGGRAERGSAGDYLIPCGSTNEESAPGRCSASRGRAVSGDWARVSPCELTAAQAV